MKARTAWIGGIAIALLVGVGLVLWLGGEDEPDPTAAVDDAEAEWEDWVGLDEDEPSDRSPRPARDRREPPSSSDERQARRAEWRERWRRAVDIAPLGPSDPGFDADDLRAALAPGRGALRECVREAGGWRAMREAFRASGEPRRRRTVSFDILPDGRVDADTVAFEPPIPEGFDPCFRTFFASARLEGVGADGARVEMPMGPPRRPRRDRSGDAGVPFRRFGRGGWRRERGEPGANEWRGRGEPGTNDRRRERGEPRPTEPPPAGE